MRDSVKELEMAINVQAVDGLINRLLQQNTSSVSRRENVQQERPDSGERVNISQQAKHVIADQSVSKLESHLLQLYTPRNN